MNHPFSKRFTHTTTLEEASHDRTGYPVAVFTRYGTYQWIAIRGEGEGAVNPSFNTGFVETRITLKGISQLVFYTVKVFV